MTKLDGLDDACVGVTVMKGEPHLVYSECKILSHLLDKGMDYDEALSHYCNNTERTVDYLSYSPGYPILMDKRGSNMSFDEFIEYVEESYGV